MIRFLVTAMVVLSLAAGTAACGKKGDLEPPPDREEERRS